MKTATPRAAATAASTSMTAAPVVSNRATGTAATWWNGESASAHAGAPTTAPTSPQRNAAPTSAIAAPALCRGTTAKSSVPRPRKSRAAGMQLAPAATSDPNPTPASCVAAPAQARMPVRSASTTLATAAIATRPRSQRLRATGSDRSVSSRPELSSSRMPFRWLAAKRATMRAKKTNVSAR